MTWWEETAPWHIRVAHTVSAVVQKPASSASACSLWNAQWRLLSLWSVLTFLVNPKMSLDFNGQRSSWFHIKGNLEAPHKVYSLCTPHYSGSDHGASSTALFLPLAPHDNFEKNILSSLLLTAEVRKYHKHISNFPDVLLSFILQHNYSLLELPEPESARFGITYCLELEVLILALIYFQRTFSVFILSCFVHVSPSWLEPTLLYCFIIMV